jgi:pre-mRNA-splicing factor 38A
MPSDFMCLVLKLLQIQPDPEVIREYILQEDSKYLRLLGAFYLRLTGKADQVQLRHGLHAALLCFLMGF